MEGRQLFSAEVYIGEAVVNVKSSSFYNTTIDLKQGKTYRFVASGTMRIRPASANNGWQAYHADAEFTRLEDYPNQKDRTQDSQSVDVGVGINGAAPNWGDYNSGNVYEQVIAHTGPDQKLKLKFFDSNHNDNVNDGGLTVSVYERLPEVSIAATDGVASENGRDPATFVVSRPSGSTAGDVKVFFTIDTSGGDAATPSTSPTSAYADGIATDGTDYTIEGATYDTADGWSVTLPNGATSANLVVRPLNDDVDEETAEAVRIVLSESPAEAPIYAVAEAAKAADVAIKPLKVTFTAVAVDTGPAADKPTAAQVAAKIDLLGAPDFRDRDAAEAQLRTWLNDYESLESIYLDRLGAENLKNNPNVEILRRLPKIIDDVRPFKEIGNANGRLALALRKPAPAGPQDQTNIRDPIVKWNGAARPMEVTLGGPGDDLVVPGTTNLPSLLVTPLAVTGGAPIDVVIVVSYWDGFLPNPPREVSRTFRISITEL